MKPTAFLPKLFRWVFTILEALTGLAAACIVVAILVHPGLPSHTHFGPLHTEMGGQAADLSLQPPPGAPGAAVFTVHAFNGNVAMTIADPAGLIDLLLGHGLPLLLIYALFLVVLFDLLRRLFRNVGRGESFTPQSVRLVQIVGGSLIVFSVVATLTKAWFAHVAFTFLMQHLQVTVSGAVVRLPHTDAYPTHFGHLLPLGDGVFWSGLLVLALAEVFRQGLALKHDNDLTV